jgi:hypothetical protein
MMMAGRYIAVPEGRGGSMSMRRGIERAAVAALLAVMALQLGHGLFADGLTNDEVLYIAGGWRQLSRGDHRLNPTHPPLAADLAALGLLGLRPRTPDYAGDDPLAYSYRFVHVENDAGAVIPRARAPAAVVTLALALLCWWWTREAGGAVAALIALALVAFHPSLLAHGHLATTDAPATLAMVAASWAFWHWCRRPRLAWAAATGLALGLGAATRLSVWILAPCFAGLALVRVLRTAPAERARAVRDTAMLAAVAAALAGLVIWAAYGLRGGGTLLPAQYLQGARFQAWHNRRGHLAYLLGERSRMGWPWYFAVAVAVKSTPGFLLALGIAAAAWVRRHATGTAALHWALPAAATFAAVSAGHIQIGERYLLPVHAYLAPLIACALASWFRAGRAKTAAVLVALALHAASGLAANGPGHIAYFNLLAGGTRGGHRVLLDSNLDWGQDLPRLQAWMRERGLASIQLAYMGADDPARLGIAREDLPGQVLYPTRPAARPLQGTVVVSPNLLFGLVPAVAPLYAPLRDRPPDGRAGVFFVYEMPPAR